MGIVRSNVLMGYNGNVAQMTWSEAALWLKGRFVFLEIQAPYFDYCTIKRRLRRFSTDVRAAFLPDWRGKFYDPVAKEWKSEKSVYEGDEERIKSLKLIKEVISRFLDGYGIEHRQDGDREVALGCIKQVKEIFDKIEI